MGARPFTYPAEAGLPLGGPAANKYVMLEVHYNNPELRNGDLLFFFNSCALCSSCV